MSDSWRTVCVGEVVKQLQRRVRTSAGHSYRLLGVRWYGDGPFHRETVSVESSKAAQFFQVRAGDFIYNRLFAWKGSFGVIPTELDDHYVSGEFPVFETDAERLEPEYLRLWMCRPAIWQAIERDSTGSTAVSRNRWKEQRFLEFELRLPPVAEQRRILRVANAFDDSVAAAQVVVAQAGVALDALRRRLIDDMEWERTPLASLVTIESKLVDPTLPQFRELPHVGVDRIESATGRLLSLSSAAADGVTSGKFLFGPEDVVYAKIRPNLRKVVWPRIAGLASADAYPLRPLPHVDTNYLHQLLLSRNFSDEATARSGRTKMPKINRTELLSIAVSCPPMESQRSIGSLLAAVAAVVNAAQLELERTAVARGAVLDDLLHGRRRIPSSFDQVVDRAS